MKKLLKSMFIVLVLSVFVACSSGGNSDGESSESGESNKGYGVIPLYTPPAGGINYIISAGLADQLNRTISIDNTQFAVEATPGASDMVVNLMERYEQDKPAIAAFAHESAHSIFNGLSEVLEGTHSELRAIGYLSDTALHIVTGANSSVETFADLKGKKIGTAVPGDTMYNFLRDLLEEQYGLTEDDYTGIPLDYTEVQDGIKNGSIDAGLIMGMPPAPAVVELAQTEDIRVLSIEPDKVESFLSDKPYYSSVVVEPGTYKNQDEELIIGTFSSIYLTHENTSEEVVYEFLKGILDNLDGLKEIHPTFNITEENIAEDMALPLHPGAQKFFEERGIEIKSN